MPSPLHETCLTFQSEKDINTLLQMPSPTSFHFLQEKSFKNITLRGFCAFLLGKL